MRFKKFLFKKLCFKKVDSMLATLHFLHICTFYRAGVFTLLFNFEIDTKSSCIFSSIILTCISIVYYFINYFNDPQN